MRTSPPDTVRQCDFHPKIPLPNFPKGKWCGSYPWFTLRESVSIPGRDHREVDATSDKIPHGFAIVYLQTNRGGDLDAQFLTNGLPNGLTLRELMFTRLTRSFIHSKAEEADITTWPLNICNAIKAARAVKGATLEHCVRTFLKRSKRNTATNYTRRLKPGDFVLQKRTTFPSNSPRKLCFKIKLDGYEIISRIATNAFKVKSVMTGLT